MRRPLTISLLIVALLAVSCGDSERQLDSADVAAAENGDETSSSMAGSLGANVEASEDAENGTVSGIIEPSAVSPGTDSGASEDVQSGTEDDRGGRTPSTAPTPRSPTPTTVGQSATVPATAATPSPTAVGDRSAKPTPRPVVTPAPAPNSDSIAPPTASPTATRVPPTVTATPVASTSTTIPTSTVVAKPIYFATLPPGSTLPTDAECAAAVRAHPSPETHPGNASSNSRTGGPDVLIDGAEGFRDDRFARRITGNFTGTTDEILRWVSCKWGIDEDITRARAWTESSWRVTTAGDQTDQTDACAYLGLPTPCPQSYGLLQVKGTIHEGTYPSSFRSTAWGVDYAMAWQRACFEGAFTWLDDQGYTIGDLIGCVGAWYSGEWFDSGANKYLGDVAENLARRPWE